MRSRGNHASAAIGQAGIDRDGTTGASRQSTGKKAPRGRNRVVEGRVSACKPPRSKRPARRGQLNAVLITRPR